MIVGPRLRRSSSSPTRGERADLTHSPARQPAPHPSPASPPQERAHRAALSDAPPRRRSRRQPRRRRLAHAPFPPPDAFPEPSRSPACRRRLWDAPPRGRPAAGHLRRPLQPRGAAAAGQLALCAPLPPQRRRSRRDRDEMPPRCRLKKREARHRLLRLPSSRTGSLLSRDEALLSIDGQPAAAAAAFRYPNFTPTANTLGATAAVGAAAGGGRSGGGVRGSFRPFAFLGTHDEYLIIADKGLRGLLGPFAFLGAALGGAEMAPTFEAAAAGCVRAIMRSPQIVMRSPQIVMRSPQVVMRSPDTLTAFASRPSPPSLPPPTPPPTTHTPHARTGEPSSSSRRSPQRGTRDSPTAAARASRCRPPPPPELPRGALL